MLHFNVIAKLTFPVLTLREPLLQIVHALKCAFISVASFMLKCEQVKKLNEIKK
jgi:hypothetical protein